MRIFVIGGVVSEDREKQTSESSVLAGVCQQVGAAIALEGCTAVLCSPFPDSADFEVMRGIASAAPDLSAEIELHYPDNNSIREQIHEIKTSLKLRLAQHPVAPPVSESASDRAYAWLLAQIRAMDRSQVVIAVGGKCSGSANMLLSLAIARRIPLLPLTFLGGAAAAAFDELRHPLRDRLGERVVELQEAGTTGAVVLTLAKMLTASSTVPRSTPPSFFISYPRARPGEADHVEMLLLRRNEKVFRDDRDLEPGHRIPGAIDAALHAATIFIALWCREYACSPNCIDEMETALDRQEDGTIDLWILVVDDTRIVPKRARNLLNYPVRTRAELEGRMLDLLQRYNEETPAAHNS